MQNNKNGFTLIILIVSVLIIGMAYLLTTRGPAVFVKNQIEDPNKVSEEELQMSYKEALEAAKKIVTKEVPSISEDDYYQGNLDAPVKIVYYSDFECPFCSSYIDDLKKAREEFGDNVVVAFRHFILSSHTQALEASLASECAAEQGNFWEMHDGLYEKSKEQKYGKEEHLSLAGDLSLDIEKFDNCLKSRKFLLKIERDIENAKRSGITGVPATYINGKSYPGAYPYENFVDQNGIEQKGLKSIIEEELENI